MPRPLAAALALAWGRCAAAAIICDPIPECADEATTIVRALIPKVGRAQSACAVGAQWGDECVTDCLSNLASVSYNGGAYSSATTAWMVGPNGTMVMSPDSGANWILKPSGTTSEINALVFPTAKVGFAVGGNAALGKTADGGEAWTWRSDLSDTRGNRLLGVHFVDERYGWVVGSSSRIYRTTDGGASWEVETWEVGRTFRGVHFADRRAGIVVGDDGFVIWSADGGKTWALRVVSTKASMRAAHCVNSTHGFVAGYLGSLFRTRDAGQSWQEPPDKSATTSMFFLGVSFAPGGLNGWAVGQRGEPPAVAPGLLLSTTDGGDTWVEDRRTKLLNQRLNSVTSHAELVPACPTTSWDPSAGERTTTTRTTTTANAIAQQVQETELELLTLMSATGAAERMVSNTAGATVTAQALSLNTSSMADGFIRVQADNSSLEVLVPASALTGLEGQNPVMLLSAFHDEQPNWDANPDSQPAMDGDLGQKALAGAPVGITIAASGAVLKITNLQEPIVFSLLPSKREGYTCAYWNETMKAWDSAGVTEVYDSKGGLRCATTHLSVFGAVLKDILAGFEQALLCNNVNAVSSEGLSRLAKGFACSSGSCLWTNPAFYIFWFLVTFQGLIMFWAWRHDRLWRNAGLWSDECWLTDNLQFVVPEKKLPEVIEHKIMQVKRFAKHPASNLSLFASTTVVQHAVASRLRISVRDLGILLQWAKYTVEPLGEDAENMTRKQMAQKLKKLHDKAKLIAFVPNIYRCMDEQLKVYQDALRQGSSRLALLRYIFVAQHPWMKLSHFSVLTPAKEQALVLSVQVFGSMWSAAMWYEGESSSYGDDPRCAKSERFVVVLARSIMVSFLSLFFASIPMLVLGILSARKFMFKESWTLEEVRKQLRSWRIKKIMFWIIGPFVVVFSIVFSTAFLANVTSDDGLKWLLSATVLFMKLFLLRPLLVGAVFVGLAFLSLRWYADPFLQRKARDRLCLAPDAELDQQASELDNGEMQQAMTLGVVGGEENHDFADIDF